MDKDKSQKLIKAIIEAEASIRMDDLPLEHKYVLNYTKKKFEELTKTPTLSLKRGNNNE